MNSRTIVPAVAVALLVGAVHLTPLSAQQLNPVAYPQNTAGRADAFYHHPFGQEPTGASAEARTQILVPASRLPPTGGKIVGIEVVPYQTGAVTYQMLDITLSHLAAPSLSQVAANNLPGPVQVVSLAPNTMVSYMGLTWHRFAFTNPNGFRYNGTQNLVVEVQKQLTSAGGPQLQMMSPSNPSRSDLPRSLAAVGVLNSGAWANPMLNQFNRPISLRLLFEDIPTMTVQSDPVPPFRFVFSIGHPVQLHAYGRQGSQYWHIVDFWSLGLLPAPVSFPPIAGGTYLDVRSPYLLPLFAGTIGTTGTATNTFTLPNAPWMVGNKIAFQSVILDPSRGFFWTSAADAYWNEG